MINVLYMTSLESSQRDLRTYELLESDGFNIIEVRTFEQYREKLMNSQVDIILSGMIFSGIKESFGLFFNFWRYQRSHIPFVIYSFNANEVPREYNRINNLFCYYKGTSLDNEQTYIELKDFLPKLFELNSAKKHLPKSSNEELVYGYTVDVFEKKYFPERTAILQERREQEKIKQRERRSKFEFQVKGRTILQRIGAWLLYGSPMNLK